MNGPRIPSHHEHGSACPVAGVAARRTGGCLPPLCIALELNRLGRSEEAVAGLQQLLADRPEHVPSYYQLAMLLGEMSLNAEAIAVCEAGALRCIVSGDRKARAELLSLKAVLEENVD